MKCHSGAILSPSLNPVKRIVLLGMPNTGKSTFFNRLTGGNAFIGNWPGITVDLLQAVIKINDQPVEVVDLPGIYDLSGFSEDEKVVQKFLTQSPLDLIIIVINASQIDRQICLPLQIKALGLPAVVVLNMADEAQRYGVCIQPELLAEKLGFPVFLISAKYGKGYQKASLAIAKSLAKSEHSYQISGLNTYSNHEITHEILEETLQGAVTMPSHLAANITAKLDQIILHPIFGLPLFFLSMFGVFWVVWALGLPSQDIMDTTTSWLLANILKPILTPFPGIIQDFFISGLWGGLATVASFVPLIILFFIFMAILEDSGYLSRAAYLMDALMAKLGLDGRSFVMQLMGFGCNVPALMGTRIMRSRALRLLTMLIIPFALCSARLQVFVFIIQAVFPNGNGAMVLFSLYLLSFVVAIVIAFLFQNLFKNKEPFVIELPPYRFPTLKQIFLRAWGEVTIFITRASGFITIGCISVWTLTNLPPGATGLETIGGQIGQWLSPIMDPIGINPYLTLTLIFGFIAKEIVIGSLAVIYGMSGDLVSQEIGHTVTFIQGYSFCIFCLLYTPCLTTLATLFQESKSVKYSLFSLGLALGSAWLISFIFYQSALALGFQ